MTGSQKPPPPFVEDEYQATTQARRPVAAEPIANAPKKPLQLPPGWHNATAEALGRTFGIVGVKAPRRKQRHH